MTSKRTWLALFVGLALAIGCGSASAQERTFTTSARHAILIDAGSGAVLYAKKPDEPFPPASMSKLMTLALIFKALKAGQLHLEDEFIMSEHAWRTGGAPSGTSAMFVPVNTRVTLNDLVQGLIVQSGNDAAIAVAEGMAGSEDGFAKAMNVEAKRIGLTNSKFANPTGLYHPDQLMTARDLAKLASFLMTEYPKYYPLFSEKTFKYRRFTFRNRNQLLFKDLGVDGLKTGYIKESGYGITASAVQDGRRLIAVVAGLTSKNERWKEAERLIQWGFRGFRKFKLFNDGEVVGQARVWGGSQWFVPLAGHGDVRVLLPRFPADQKLHAQVVYKGPLKPPIKQGEKVADLRVTNPTGVTNTVPLYATEDVKVASTWWRGFDSAVHLAFGWLP